MKKTVNIIRKGAEKLALSAGASLAVAGTAMAQSFNVGGGNVSEIPIYTGPLEMLISNLVNIVLVGVGLVAVIYLIWGGVTYVTAGGDAEKASKGRITITNAIIGIVIIAASLAIYNYVIGSL